MIIKQANFVGSYPRVSKCPESTLPEYSFIGRSNVGKSSLINMILGRKDIAKVSNTPGKTQLINYFEINKSWHLVDLPGYGYAQLSKKHRASLEKMIKFYLKNRENLSCTFLLIDSRIPLQDVDLEFANWLGANQIPFVIVYTKVDKLKGDAKHENIINIKNGLLKTWEDLPEQFVTSSRKKQGRDHILDFIADINANY